MQIQNATALVTGANRGIGRAYVEALVKAGAKRIYATARQVEALQEVVAIAPDRIIPLTLDITNEAQVQQVAGLAQDINLLINNAGVASVGGLFDADAWGVAQAQMDTNYFGTLRMVYAFTPILQRNGGGTIVNLLSIVSVVNIPNVASYSASKAALYSATQAMRAKLAGQNIQVIGVYPGPIDTDMSSHLEIDKTSPIIVAEKTLAAIVSGTEDVYPDPMAVEVFKNLSEPLKVWEKQFAAMMPA
jgi:NAD(P)-dependent dehydrogenase (short-subunit alcohol dehydrogenase family)